MNIQKHTFNFLKFYPFVFFINKYFLVIPLFFYSLISLKKFNIKNVNTLFIFFFLIIIIKIPFYLHYNLYEFSLLFKYILIPLSFLLISNSIKLTDGDIFILMQYLVMSLTIIGLLLFFQNGPYSIDLNRIYNIFRNNGYWLLNKQYLGAPTIGGISGIAFIISFCLLSKNKSYIYFALINLAILIISSQRGAVVSCFFAILFLSIFHKDKINIKYLLIITFAFLIIFLYSYFNILKFAHRIDQLILLNDDPTYGRLNQYYAYLHQSLNRPFYGHGFGVLINNLSSHNEYLFYFHSCGFIGLISFISFLIVWLKRIFLNSTITSVFIFYLMLGLVENFSTSSGSLSYIIYLFFISLSISYVK